MPGIRNEESTNTGTDQQMEPGDGGTFICTSMLAESVPSTP